MPTVDIDDLEGELDERHTWEMNTPMMYANMKVHQLVWPAMSVQWLENDRVLTGTHTGGEDANYIEVTEVRLSGNQDALARVKRGELPDLDGTAEEFREYLRIPHPDDVHVVLQSPHSADILATKSEAGSILIYSMKEKAKRATLNLEETGFTLCWGPENIVATGGDAQTVYVFDIQRAAPLCRLEGHTGSIEEVSFHRDGNVLASVSSDGFLRVWDTRAKSCAHLVRACQGDVNAVKFHPSNDHWLLSGGDDAILKHWDLRSLDGPSNQLCGHEKAIRAVHWAPLDPYCAGSACEDQINIWNLSRIGMEQVGLEVDDGAPELLFEHKGHTDPIEGFSFHPTQPWRVASVDTENSLQVWEVLPEVCQDSNCSEDVNMSDLE